MLSASAARRSLAGGVRGGVGRRAAPDTTDQDIGEQVNGVHMQTLADSHMHDKESDEGGRMVAGQNKTSDQKKHLLVIQGSTGVTHHQETFSIQKNKCLLF